eukprot:8902344-Prorocentrum_lima.AAC.1
MGVMVSPRGRFIGGGLLLHQDLPDSEIAQLRAQGGSEAVVPQVPRNEHRLSSRSPSACAC